MAKDKLNQYDSTAANNTDCGGVDTGEGTMTIADINNFAREIMSHLADFQAGTAGIDVLSLTDDTDTNQIKLQAPTSVTTTTTLTLPDGDGSASQYLQTDGSGTLSWSTINIIPSGSIISYGGSSAPSGWLLCYGQAISRTTYADLFTAIGTTYGSGDGSTTFNLPDLRGRVVAGQDDMGGSSANRLTNQSGGLNGDTLGATGGSETHTITTGQLPSGHYYLKTNTIARVDNYANFNYNPYVPNFTNNLTAGGGSAHNNVQPTIILNYIIKE